MRGVTTTFVAALAIGLLASGLAWAGDLKIGKDPLETDDNGKLTKAGQSAAVTEIEAAPGNEEWTLHLWAQIDKPAEGPLYVEFYRKRDGKELVAHRHEIADYAGDKYVSVEIMIDRSQGFAAGEMVDLAFVQNVGGRDAKKAKATVALKASTAPAPKEAEPEPEDDLDDEEEAEDDGSEAADPEPAAAPAGPPPVEPGDKKGCRAGATTPTGWWAVVVLALVARRRSRDS